MPGSSPAFAPPAPGFDVANTPPDGAGGYGHRYEDGHGLAVAERYAADSAGGTAAPAAPGSAPQEGNVAAKDDPWTRAFEATYQSYIEDNHIDVHNDDPTTQAQLSDAVNRATLAANDHVSAIERGWVGEAASPAPIQGGSNVYRSIFSDAGETDREATKFDHLRTVGSARSVRERKLAESVIRGELSTVDALRLAAENNTSEAQWFAQDAEARGESPDVLEAHQDASRVYQRSLGPNIREVDEAPVTPEGPAEAAATSKEIVAEARRRKLGRAALARFEERQRTAPLREQERAAGLEREAAKIAALDREIAGLQADLDHIATRRQ